MLRLGFHFSKENLWVHNMHSSWKIKREKSNRIFHFHMVLFLLKHTTVCSIDLVHFQYSRCITSFNDHSSKQLITKPILSAARACCSSNKRFLVVVVFLCGFFFRKSLLRRNITEVVVCLECIVLVSPLHLTEDQRAPYRAAISMEPCSFCKTGTQAADLFE